MGATYSNLVVVGRATDAVVGAVESIGDRGGAFVTEDLEGFVAVFPDDGDRHRSVADVGARLSAALGAVVLAFDVDDSDVLVCTIRSPAGAASVEAPARSRRMLRSRRARGGVGDYLALLGRSGVPAARADVASVLEAPYVFADDRHEDLLVALGLPRFLRGVGYRYLVHDGPGILPVPVRHVGSASG